MQAEATLTAAPLVQRGARREPRRRRPPQGARRSALLARLPPAGHDGPRRSVGFPRLRGAVLPKGASLKIYVTAKNEIGAYIEYRIGSGKLHQDPALPGARLEEAQALRMTATARGRVAIAALIVVLAFGAAFAVRKATAGSSKAASLPAPLVLPSCDRARLRRRAADGSGAGAAPSAASGGSRSERARAKLHACACDACALRPGAVGAICSAQRRRWRRRWWPGGRRLTSRQADLMDSPQSPTVVAGYRIDGTLGEGGMGTVYRATQLSLERVVALKVLTAELSSDPGFRERFRREGLLQAALDHPHIVTVYEAGEAEERLFLAMRMVEGPTLKDLIMRRQLDDRRALRLLTQVAEALDAAHAKGLIHRDVKPQNVLVGAGDHAYLADFGLTKGSDDAAMTETGQFVGTIDYISPEQARGERATAPSDVYALTAVLCECLTGKVPYVKATEERVLLAHLSEPPPSLSQAALGPPRRDRRGGGEGDGEGPRGPPGLGRRADAARAARARRRARGGLRAGSLRGGDAPAPRRRVAHAHAAHGRWERSRRHAPGRRRRSRCHPPGGGCGGDTGSGGSAHRGVPGPGARRRCRRRGKVRAGGARRGDPRCRRRPAARRGLGRLRGDASATRPRRATSNCPSHPAGSTSRAPPRFRGSRSRSRSRSRWAQPEAGEPRAPPRSAW